MRRTPVGMRELISRMTVSASGRFTEPLKCTLLGGMAASLLLLRRMRRRTVRPPPRRHCHNCAPLPRPRRSQPSQSMIFQNEALRLILPSVNSNRSHPRTSMRSPVTCVPRIVHSETPRSPHVQWRSSPYSMSGIPSNRDWIPSRACCLPIRRRPPGAGPRGISKTQSSVKNDITASTSWALNASRNACIDGVATFVPAMKLASVMGRPEPRASTHPTQPGRPYRLTGGRQCGTADRHSLVAKLDRSADRILRTEIGVSYRRFLLLSMVRDLGGTTQRALADRLNVSEPSVSRMTSVLREAGMLDAD